MSKELKQKAIQKYKEHLVDPNYFENSEEESYYTGFFDGYHECQKEHEWHYVKDGDLPKDEKDMLMSEQLILLTKMKGTDNLNLSIGQYNFSTQEFSYPRFVGLTDVIAWKEIVLPKESE